RAIDRFEAVEAMHPQVDVEPSRDNPGHTEIRMSALHDRGHGTGHLHMWGTIEQDHRGHPVRFTTYSEDQRGTEAYRVLREDDVTETRAPSILGRWLGLALEIRNLHEAVGPNGADTWTDRREIRALVGKHAFLVWPTKITKQPPAKGRR